MKTLTLHGTGRVSLIDAADPEVRPGDALIRIEASGLCGSERSALDMGMPQGNAGHEACGVIEHVPAGAEFAVGERVGISAVSGCGVCDDCRAGRETRCSRGPVITPSMHAELVAAPLSTLRRLPAGTEPATGVLLSGDGLGVPVRAARRVPTGAGQRVLVVGLGPVGLAHVMVRAHGGALVEAIEPSPRRRAMAAEFGAARVYSPDERIDDGFDLVIEATGLQPCLDRAFELAKPGATVLQSGECGTVSLRASEWVVHKEVTYIGSWYYNSEDYPAMLALHSDGLALDRLVSDRFPANEAQEAFGRFFAGDSGKVVLLWGTATSDARPSRR